MRRITLRRRADGEVNDALSTGPFTRRCRRISLNTLRRQIETLETRQGLGERTLRAAQIVDFLQVHPKVGAGAEPMREPQGRIGRDRSITVENAGDAIGRDFELSRELGSRNAKCREFFFEVFAWVYRCAGHLVLSDSQ